jgi:6-phosphofructokinase 1
MSERNPDFTIPLLGAGRFPSPMPGFRFVGDDQRVLHPVTLGEVKDCLARGVDPPSMELAGPREQLFFDPATLAAGIVTCGGICPGINDVIRAIVLSLHHHYGVRRILGFRYGFSGLVRPHGDAPPMELTPERVNRIHEMGGSILGSSRGPQSAAAMVDTLADLGVGILFAIGGDGTLRGAQTIGDEAARRGLPLAVVGIPKTIDNDVSFVQKTFGFETAVTEARRATYAANTEAEAARNGIGLVKLMGRDSGFIAAHAVLADTHVNFCLVPEVRFTMPRFLEALTARIESRGHAVVVVAEGAGQDLLAAGAERDPSGNVRYGDIGAFLRDEIRAHFKRAGIELTLKYINPSYTIRSQPAIAHDAAFCLMLGHNAVHAGMSGRTNLVVGFWNHQFTHVPIPLAVSRRKCIDPQGLLWSSVLASTGQPRDLC